MNSFVGGLLFYESNLLWDDAGEYFVSAVYYHLHWTYKGNKR